MFDCFFGELTHIKLLSQNAHQWPFPKRHTQKMELTEKNVIFTKGCFLFRFVSYISLFSSLFIDPKTVNFTFFHAFSHKSLCCITDFTVICNFNPIKLRKAKIVYNFGLSECNRVNLSSNYERFSMMK